MRGCLTVVAGVRVAADPERVWAAAVDWSAQRQWILATTAAGGRGLGATVTGWTGVGPFRFADTMVITQWEPPMRCTVRHTGRIVRGEGIFEVLPNGDRTEFRWTERILLPEPVLALMPASMRPALTRLAYAIIAPVARASLGYSLIRLARLLDGART